MVQQRFRTFGTVLAVDLGNLADDQRRVAGLDEPLDPGPQPCRHAVEHGFPRRQQTPRARICEPVLSGSRKTLRQWELVGTGRRTTTDSAARIASMLDEVSVMLNEINGGLSDNDANDVAVKPTGPPVDIIVTIATPADDAEVPRDTAQR